MAAETLWSTLPTVIIVEILSYLPLKDKLSAISTCKRWRSCIWHPSLWKSIKFNLRRGSRIRSKYLAENCGRFVREVQITFSSKTTWDVKECAKLLKILSENRNIQSLSICPTNCHIEWPERNAQSIADSFYDSIEKIIKTARRLKHLSFGCLEELVCDSGYLLELLAVHQAHSLQSLHIASIKEDPDAYGMCDVNYGHFQALKNLKCLSIDYDYLTNALLDSVIENHHVGLEKLVINIHGIETPHQGRITNQTWWRLVCHCPNLQVTLNLIHSVDGVHHLLDILRPNMPLTHLRMFFCSEINVAAINFIAQHNSCKLQSIHIIDGFVRQQCNTYYADSYEDPFVMLAWKCPNLRKFTMIGYEFQEEDVLAIARLRGPQLETLDIPDSCIASTVQEGEDTYVQVGLINQYICDEVSKSLGREWHPLPDCQLHSAVKDIHADADTAYLDILLEDQQFFN